MRVGRRAGVKDEAGAAILEEAAAADIGEDVLSAPWIPDVAVLGDGRFAAASAIIYKPDQCWLGVCDLDGSSTSPIATVKLPDSHSTSTFVLSTQSSCITVITLEGDVWRWDIQRGRPADHQKLTGPVTFDGLDHDSEAPMSVDGRLAAERVMKGVQVWDLNTGKLTAMLVGHRGEVNCASISADGRRTVSGGDDCLVKVWDLESKTCLATLEGHTGRVRAVALSPDGQHVMSSGDTGVIQVWQP